MPSLEFRDAFFKEREKITHDTGWYPYITGSRANFTHFTAEKSYKYWKIEKNKIPYVHLGKPLSIKNVASDFSATAMLLQCEKGNVLLDTGFGIEEQCIEMIDFIFISHFQYDHTGGVIQILQKKDIPVIMSSITLDYMLNLDLICEEDKKRLLKNAVIADSLNDRSYIVTTLEFFDNYHCPGAIGIKYKFNDFDIIYAGDICLKNGFYDYRTDFDKIIANNNRKKYVFLDAALVKKSELSTGEENYSDLSDEIFNSVDNEKILFVSKGTEMLFNIYIKLFAQSVLCSKETNFVVSDELYKILKNVLRSWFISKYRNDPFIKNTLSSGRANFAETRRLYPLSKSKEFIEKNNVIFILSLNDMEDMSEKEVLLGSKCYLTGPLALENTVYECIEDIAYSNIKHLASSDWSFHSNKESLDEFIMEHQKCDIVLFHSFPKILSKYKKSFSDNQSSRIHIINKDEIIL